MSMMVIYALVGTVAILVVAALSMVLLSSKRRNGKVDTADNALAKSINKEVKKRNSKFSESALLLFLDEVDDAYTEFYLRKNITRFKKYASQELVAKMVRQLRVKRIEIGNPVHRKIIWNMINTSGDTIRVKKSTIFTKTTLMGDTPIKVGDDNYEWWSIEVLDNQFKVIDILGG